MVEMLPYVRRIHIRDMYGHLIVITRVNGEVEYLYPVTAVFVDSGVIMQTCCINETRLQGCLVHAPTHGVTFAYRRVGRVVCLLPYIDMYYMHAVVSFNRLLAVFIIAGRGDVIQASPLERDIVLANIDRVIRNAISLVDKQRKAVNTVTSVDVRQPATILSGNIQGIGVALYLTVFVPSVNPQIRSIHIGYIHPLVAGREARPNLQMKHNHTIATVNRWDGVAVETGCFVEAFRQAITIVCIYLNRIACADGVEHMRLVCAVEIDIEVVDTIQRIEGNQCVIIMHGVILQRGSVLLFVSGSPFVRESGVNGFAYIKRIAEDMGLMNGKVEHHGTIATILVRHGVLVFAGNVQRISVRSVFACTRFIPCICPCVRQLAVGHNDALRRNDDTVANEKTQLDDAIAAVQGGQRIVIDTCVMEVTFLGSVIFAFKEMTVKLNRITIAYGIYNLRAV